MNNVKFSRTRANYTIAVLLLVGLTACTTTNRPDLGGMTFSSDPLLGKIVWHDLITEDLDSARRFYAGLFGWTFEGSVGSRGEDYVLARKGDIIVAGILGIDPPGDGESYSRWLPYISVDDVDAAVARSTEAGATVAVSARNVGLGRAAAIIDPQGAVIGLARSGIGDPDDATTVAAPGKPAWAELVADDTKGAASFYGTVAGYQADTIERRGGEYTFLLSDGVRRAGLFENPADGEYGPVWLTTFSVQDPAIAAAKAEELGGKIILPVSPDLRDGTTAVVTDPAGAILVLRAWQPKGMK